MKQAQGKQMPKIRKCLRMDMAKNQKSYTPEFKQQIMELSKYAAYSMTAELTVNVVENACLSEIQRGLSSTVTLEASIRARHLKNIWTATKIRHSFRRKGNH